MLPVFIVIAFWAILGLGVFSLAVRRRGARAGEYRRPSYGARQAGGLLLVVLFVGFGIVLPLVFLTGNHSNASAQIGGIKLTRTEKTGREIFGEKCAFCHTLAAANANGKVGPNLDLLKPSEQVVLNTINNGCLQDPASTSATNACLGYGTMPSGIVQGTQAQDVAAFVSKVAGQE